MKDLLRANIAGFKAYSSAREEYKDKSGRLIFLNANENPFDNGINRYPDPQQEELKTEVSKISQVAADSILLGNGSDEVLDLLFRAFCEPRQDNIITLPPTYGMYGVLAALNAIEEIKVLLQDDFQPDVIKILGSIDSKTKIIFLCSPNNPTGNSFSPAAVEQILLNFNGLVVIDEAYIDFSQDSGWLSRLEEFPNLVITRTLSKAYGMAGIRLGICYASPEIIGILNTIKMPYNVNELTQKKALENLRDRKKVLEQVSQINTERKNLIKELQGVSFIKKVYQSDANFILIRVDDAGKRYRQLLDEGIITRNRSEEPLCKNTLRITVGTPQENRYLLQTINKI